MANKGKGKEGMKGKCEAERKVIRQMRHKEKIERDTQYRGLLLDRQHRFSLETIDDRKYCGLTPNHPR